MLHNETYHFEKEKVWLQYRLLTDLKIDRDGGWTIIRRSLKYSREKENKHVQSEMEIYSVSPTAYRVAVWCHLMVAQ